MPQSARVTARFTSTIPHASSNISQDGPRNIPPRFPGPPGETPLEKVKRLRAAVDKAKKAEINGFDRWIARGRVWADVAHTITTTTLIAASIIAGGVTIYALTDMIIYNRKKKAEFFEEQNAKLNLAIHTARKAVQDGTASEAQIKLIKMEDDRQASLQSGTQKESILSKCKNLLFSGLEKDGEDGQELNDKNLSNIDGTSFQKQSYLTSTTDKKPSVISSKATKESSEDMNRLSAKSFLNEKSPEVKCENDKEDKSKSWKLWVFGK
ncbi:hypothetical protein GcM3_033022 [Golovinomyces cichoracearum]|uniref:Uncharacterized protein n=1 Tax=Golovinomyces cichoracearum TaxID=62708 RepID=A0A420J4G2_9PEZI|nr:hypothetical protein GcM3_033022 [Golovinomyces cichoracearum]